MSGGRTAPDGYRWCRGHSGAWHFRKAAEVAHPGKPRSTARSVCGLWASLLPGQDGWAEVTQRAAPEPRRVCLSCIAGVIDAQWRDRVGTPTVEQARLF